MTAIEELAQKLYNEDGHSGNLYRVANPRVVKNYENKALDILEEE